MTRTTGAALESSERAHYSDTTLNVLGYQEDGEWVALALEMDLRGYGGTWEEAVEELRDLVFAQIGFAVSKRQPEMIWRNAEDEYWSRFKEVQRASFYPRDASAATMSAFHAGSLAIPASLVEAAQAGWTSRADA